MKCSDTRATKGAGLLGCISDLLMQSGARREIVKLITGQNADYITLKKEVSYIKCRAVIY